MTQHERSRLSPVASLLFVVVVAGLAVVVLFEAASAVGLSPIGSGSGPATRPPDVAVALTPSAAPASASTPVAIPSASASAGPSMSASPSPSSASAPPSSTLVPPPAPGPFSIDLYQRGDFVSEMNKVSCVAAAMQTMINIQSTGADTSVATQQRLYALARKLSSKRLVGPGAEPEGWAKGLSQLGFGPYAVDAEPTRAAAIKVAARALRLTGRPVGILAWRGAHSWVMSGFKATADPALTDRFTVTAVFIEDVWYPRVSSIWGPSRPPDSIVPVRLLPEDFLAWRRPTGPYPELDGRYVLVLPLAATG